MFHTTICQVSILSSPRLIFYMTTYTAPVLWHGFESDAIAVARAEIMLHMLLKDEAVQTLVNAWWSALWTKKTTLSFHASAQKVLAAHSDGSHPLQEDVAAIVMHWAGRLSPLSRKKAIAAWQKVCDDSCER
jgi:hypothetical protein